MGSSSITDAELVFSIRNGDKHAFDVVYQRHWLRLFRIACRIITDENAAQDIIQDSFISFWEKGCHKDIHSIEAYLYQTVRFRCFMHLRSGTISKKHLEHFSRIQAASSAGVGGHPMEAREMEELLDQSIRVLPEKCREVFYMSRVENMPNKKIAERLHISPKTVENQITKALRHLRLSLEKLAVLLLLLNS
jgi:RNA polymerase sigma-70 factor (family 1)